MKTLHDFVNEGKRTVEDIGDFERSIQESAVHLYTVKRAKKDKYRFDVDQYSRRLSLDSKNKEFEFGILFKRINANKMRVTVVGLPVSSSGASILLEKYYTDYWPHIADDEFKIEHERVLHRFNSLEKVQKYLAGKAGSVVDYLYN